MQVYFIDLALTLDNASNIMMLHLLNNLLLIKIETISSVFCKKSLTDTLSTPGKALNAFLNFIDKNHSFNSIIYDVEA